MNNARKLIAIGLLPLLTSCDPMYGAGRSATLHATLPPAEVERVIKETPGVASVEYQRVTNSPSWTLTGQRIFDPPYDMFFIKGAIGFAVLSLGAYENTNQTFRLYANWLGSPPPRAQFDESYSLITNVHQHLYDEFPTLPAPRDSKEYISRKILQKQ